MNTRQLTFPLPGDRPAVLTLPQPVAPDVLGQLAHALASELGELRRQSLGAAGDPGQAEYLSWLAPSTTVRQ